MPTPWPVAAAWANGGRIDEQMGRQRDRERFLKQIERCRRVAQPSCRDRSQGQGPGRGRPFPALREMAPALTNVGLPGSDDYMPRWRTSVSVQVATGLSHLLLLPRSPLAPAACHRSCDACMSADRSSCAHPVHRTAPKRRSAHAPPCAPGQARPAPRPGFRQRNAAGQRVSRFAHHGRQPCLRRTQRPCDNIRCVTARPAGRAAALALLCGRTPGDTSSQTT